MNDLTTDYAASLTEIENGITEVRNALTIDAEIKNLQQLIDVELATVITGTRREDLLWARSFLDDWTLQITDPEWPLQAYTRLSPRDITMADKYLGYIDDGFHLDEGLQSKIRLMRQGLGS